MSSINNVKASDGISENPPSIKYSMSMSEPSMKEKRKSAKMSSCFISGLRVGSVLRTWAELSAINLMHTQTLESITSGHTRRRSFGVTSKESVHNVVPPLKGDEKSTEELLEEQFVTYPVNVTSLMSEGQQWGCFYIFPELYADIYSPVERIRRIEDVPEIVGGVLTRDLVTACLSYLKRTPILGDFVYIKLDLSSKHLMNIEVLQHYKYLVYLDLSSNYLTELTVLSHLPYLQFLCVAFNRLSTVLEYETPQWFLTEVLYKYNSVKRIRDISMFWSITILDLSHNNIKCISGLENLRFLRRLDLSFNHIQRLENLNHLRLLWLDVSYNNISSFEFGFQSGLFTLMHLEFLNLNENNLTSMKMFSGCTRLRELHARNNRFSTLLELAVYMRQMRRLIILDLRANPICSVPSYKDVAINTFPLLLSLDALELDPVEQRRFKMAMAPDIGVFATRRLLRLLYIEQLFRANVSRHVPPADTTQVPLVIIVGYEGVGKGALTQRLATECSKHVELAKLHTTAPYHLASHYHEITPSRFDDMLLAGDFLTYSEMDGESYGLSREEASITPGKVKITSMDLSGALMLEMRGRRPYLILASMQNKITLVQRQEQRKEYRNSMREKRLSLEIPMEKSTLQVLISGRILITGILNEILLSFPDEKEQSEFVIESECSLLMDSDAREAVQEFAKGFNMMTLLGSSTTSLEEACDRAYKNNHPNDASLCSLYKESQNTDEYASDVANGHDSYQYSKKSAEPNPGASQTQSQPEKLSSVSRPKSVDFTRYVSSTWKGNKSMSGLNSTKSSKSVTFTSQDNTENTENTQAAQAQIGATVDPSGLLIEPPPPTQEKEEASKQIRSLSTKLPMAWPGGAHGAHGAHGPQRTASGGSIDDLDLWLAFLVDIGLLRASDANANVEMSEIQRHDTKVDDPDLVLRQLEFYHKIPSETLTTNIRDDYEDIHRKCPGLFWDTVTMDNPDKAFKKVKTIIQTIINGQKDLKPMFDIDFANMEYYPTVQKRLAGIYNQIAPQRLFY